MVIDGSTSAEFKQKGRLENIDYKTLTNESASNLDFPSPKPE
jgi:hypothetical protein